MLWLDGTELMGLAMKPVALSALSIFRVLFAKSLAVFGSRSSFSVVNWILATTAAALKLCLGPCKVLLLSSFVWGLLQGVISMFVCSSPDSSTFFSDVFSCFEEIKLWCGITFCRLLLFDEAPIGFCDLSLPLIYCMLLETIGLFLVICPSSVSIFSITVRAEPPKLI